MAKKKSSSSRNSTPTPLPPPVESPHTQQATQASDPQAKLVLMLPASLMRRLRRTAHFESFTNDCEVSVASIVERTIAAGLPALPSLPAGESGQRGGGPVDGKAIPAAKKKPATTGKRGRPRKPSPIARPPNPCPSRDDELAALIGEQAADYASDRRVQPVEAESLDTDPLHELGNPFEPIESLADESESLCLT